MKLAIRDYCIRCGICEDLYPDLFHFDWEKDEIEIKQNPVPEYLHEMAKNAMRDCAIAAIYLDK